MSTLSGMDHETSRCVASHLAVLTDQLSEALVSLHSDETGSHDWVEECLLQVWKLRWELGFTGGMVSDDLGEAESAEAAE